MTAITTEQLAAALRDALSVVHSYALDDEEYRIKDRALAVLSKYEAEQAITQAPDAEEHLTALPALVAEVERLRGIVREFLDCPEIADCAPQDRDPDTDALERRARAALPEEPADG